MGSMCLILLGSRLRRHRHLGSIGRSLEVEDPSFGGSRWAVMPLIATVNEDKREGLYKELRDGEKGSFIRNSTASMVIVGVWLKSPRKKAERPHVCGCERGCAL